jgi:hypothetical protein
VSSESVTVGYVHPNDVAHSFHQSLLALIGHDLESKGRVARGGWLAVRCYGADGIPGARNFVVKEFLNDPKRSEWLWWIDTDMGFAPDTVDRLIDYADAIERPIVGGLCFAQKAVDPDGFGGWRTQMAPTVFDWADRDEGETGFLSRRDYPVNTIVRVAGTGSACLLVHRSVFEAVQEKYGATWYDRVPNPTAGNALLGEDLSFCLRAGALGVPIHVHTGIRTTHAKTVWLAEEDYWSTAQAEPATVETAVLVPVMGRPANAAPFMASLRASTSLATVYAICDQGDTETITAWKQAGARRILFRPADRTVKRQLPDGSGERVAGTFAEKVNVAYGQTHEPWLFVTGDDVRFRPGWLDHAQTAAGDQFHVIGTNDLGNPRVMSGEHSTHLLIRRAYVDQIGAGWDGPKVLAHG